MGGSWVEVDWSLFQEPPSDAQREQSLSRLRFRAVPVTAEPVHRVIAAFRGMLTNGGAYVAGFDVVEADDVAAWFISRNREEYGLADWLVRSPVFAEAMPEVSGPGLIAATDFERSSSLLLDGELARQLQWSDLRTDPPMAGAEAKALGAGFCASCFGERYDDIDVDWTSARWSGWFKGVAWDATWVITDRRFRHLTVLCLTDVD